LANEKSKQITQAHSDEEIVDFLYDQDIPATYSKVEDFNCKEPFMTCLIESERIKYSAQVFILTQNSAVVVITAKEQQPVLPNLTWSKTPPLTSLQ